MYVAVSRYKDYTRVRILRKVKTNNVWTSKLIEHVGSARDDTELALLRTRATQRMVELRLQLSLLDELETQKATGVSRVTVSSPFAYGLWSVMGGPYDRMNLPNDLLKYLVLARIALPKSKLTTVRYLSDNLRLNTSLSSVYRYMDSLSKDNLMATLLAHAQQRAISRGEQAISVVFYDVTTLYFETDEEDLDSEAAPGLRKKGYSKDHRYDLPQIVVGLTVDGEGFPLDFQVYEGNTYEGHTLLDGITAIRQKLQLDSAKLTVVADAGMLSAANLTELETQGYRYIVGARIRSLSSAQAERITTWDYASKGTLDTTSGGRRMIVTYSDKRAKRSRQNRDRLIRRLQSKLDHGQVVKKSKYIVLANDKKLEGSIDQNKLAADARFDGLKGYVTNTDLHSSEVVAHYGNLWHVEKSFRMSKSDLRARPTFHFKRERVIAHLLICICALSVLKEFEERLRIVLPEVGLSLALEQLLAIQEYKLLLPDKREGTTVYSQFTEDQEKLLLL
jgi:transposase